MKVYFRSDTLYRGARGENLNTIDTKVLRSLLFGYGEKVVKRCQDKVHKHTAEASGNFVACKLEDQHV
jgi:hypothetical protein